MMRFGVLGLGFMGRTHLASLARHAEAKVVVVCDTEPERLVGPLAPGGGNVPVRGAAWEESGLRRVGKPEEVFAAADVDAVVLAVPTYLHADLAVAALSAGKHVFCEKPMALALSDCDRMIAAARKAERVLMVGHCLRFWGEYLAAAEIVRSREFGHLQSIILTRRGAVPQFGARNWFADHAKSGGAVMDLHIHDVDYCLFLLGPPRAVHARGEIGPSGGIDHVVSWFDYGSEGPIVQMEGTWMAGKAAPFVMAFSMYFPKGSLVYSSDRPNPMQAYADAARDVPVGPTSAYEAEITHFIRCVSLGMDSRIVPPESSRQAVALVLAELRSIRTGNAVGVE